MTVHDRDRSTPRNAAESTGASFSYRGAQAAEAEARIAGFRSNEAPIIYRAIQLT